MRLYEQMENKLNQETEKILSERMSALKMGKAKLLTSEQIIAEIK